MVIGFTLGLDYSNALVMASTICLTSVVFSYAGLKFGDITHKHYERAAQISAGSLLLIMAFLQWKGFL
jgi:putative Mn2+ efflux pump MntP